MTVREQLAAQLAAIRAGWALGGPKLTTGWHRNGDIMLDARLPVPPILMLRWFQFRVNAAEICGAKAGHLLFVYHHVPHQVPLDDGHGAACRVIVGMTYGERPWDSILLTADPPADFGALLDTLEPGDVVRPAAAALSREEATSMTMREQLTVQLAAIRAGWATTPPAALPRIEEITLECQPAVLSVSATRGVIGRINASPVGGAGAEYLLVRGIRIEPIATGGGGGLGYRVTVLIAIRERPWVGQTTDLDALLDALDGVAGAEPGRPETWRTRRGML